MTYRTLIGLLEVTGMRVGEAIGLARDDLDWSHRRVLVREGKFGASRELPLHPRTIDALEMYAQLRDQCRPQPKSPFFISMAGTRLIHENVHWTFRRLEVEHVHPHRFRHDTARRLVQQVDLPTVAALLGHSRLDTVRLYAQPDAPALERAVQTLEVD